MNALITGVAGFIGSNVAKKLLDLNYSVVGIDNLNDYYDVNLKKDRLDEILEHEHFQFIRGDISDNSFILDLFSKNQFNIVINLAAQAGVRYSIENPDVYIQSNIVGFYNILEACRQYPVDHLIYASSSSVYGNNKKVPFEENDFVDSPASLYAVTKKSNELMASAYSHLYDIKATGLRFFTVYGPKGRPDMAYFKFADMYFNNQPIHIYNNGDFANDLYRDFTYIDDIVEGIIDLLPIIPQKSDEAPAHQVYNIGNNTPVKLMDFVATLENAFAISLDRDVKFKKVFEPLKAGDVPKTFASTDKLNMATGFRPETPISVGLKKFTDWYVSYYHKV